MAVDVSGPLNFAFKADDELLVQTHIFAPSDSATKQRVVTLRAIKGAFPPSHRLALLKSTLKDTSLDAFSDAVGELEFVPLSGFANGRARLGVQLSSNCPLCQRQVLCLEGIAHALVH